MMYVCQGEIEHIINGEPLMLKQGECLLLNTHSIHEIKQASIDDIAINFIIHPNFFEHSGSGMTQNNPVRIFLHNLIRSNESQGEYFHFKVSDIFEVQNLIENMIYSLVNRSTPNIMITQMSMNLLFMYFSENLLKIVKIKDKLYHELLVDAVIDYISTNYKTAELRVVAQLLNQSDSNLSRLIKKQTGKTYKELLMSLRFYKALELLETTTLSIDTIIESVGYENKSYFHRLFKEKINSTPNQYRQNFISTNKDPI
jgi:AraC family transcriptional regulator, L-rhamnose operon regulatory protein RhaS